jgi:hypothetical protein
VKRLLVCLVLVLALALPAQASARQREYDGTIAPSGELGFKVKLKKGEKPKVKGFTFFRVPITCDGGPNTTFGRITGGLKVRKKRFGAQLTNDAGTSNLHVAGTVSKRASSGTIRVFGAVPLEQPRPDPGEPFPTGTNCDTGVLNWTATRA